MWRIWRNGPAADFIVLGMNCVSTTSEFISRTVVAVVLCCVHILHAWIVPPLVPLPFVHNISPLS